MSSDPPPRWLWSSRNGAVLFVLLSSTGINLITSGGGQQCEPWYVRFARPLGGLLVLLGALAAARLEGLQLEIERLPQADFLAALANSKRALYVAFGLCIALSAMGVLWSLLG